MNTFISVVIPVYNQISTLGNTIVCVLGQTHRNLEVMIVDDGSEDDIEGLVSTIRDDRVYYYKLEHKNANAARNFGIIKSRGKYIAMLDADDIWMPNHLEDCLATLQSSSADGLYGSVIVRKVGSGQDIPIMAKEPEENEPMANYLLRTGYGAQTSTLFLSAESAKNVLWDPELNRHQDYDFIVRYSKKYRFTTKEEPTVIYCENSRQSKIDLRSCIRFIAANEEDIDPRIYNRYNLDMLALAEGMGAEADIVDHYRKEATYYKEYLSFFSYIHILRPTNRYKSTMCKLKYLYHVLRIKVEL